MVSPMSWVLKLAEVKITNAIHNEAIESINKNQEKYLFITINDYYSNITNFNFKPLNVSATPSTEVSLCKEILTKPSP